MKKVQLVANGKKGRKFRVTKYFPDNTHTVNISPEFPIPHSWQWLKQESGKNLDVYMDAKGNIIKVTEIFTNPNPSEFYVQISQEIQSLLWVNKPVRAISYLTKHKRLLTKDEYDELFKHIQRFIENNKQ